MTRRDDFDFVLLRHPITESLLHHRVKPFYRSRRHVLQNKNNSKSKGCPTASTLPPLQADEHHSGNFEASSEDWSLDSASKLMLLNMFPPRKREIILYRGRVEKPCQLILTLGGCRIPCGFQACGFFLLGHPINARVANCPLRHELSHARLD